MRYFIELEGETKGPYTLGQLRSMWAAGTITGDTRHRPESANVSHWLPLQVMQNDMEAAELHRAGPGRDHAARPAFRGPPENCRHCGGDIKKGAEATSSVSGCLVVIVGLVLTPVLIGVPVLLYGLHLMSKREGFWRCKSCGEKFPREIRWYELA